MKSIDFCRHHNGIPTRQFWKSVCFLYILFSIKITLYSRCMFVFLPNSIPILKILPCLNKFSMFKLRKLKLRQKSGKIQVNLKF